jgi:hypothetical protein
MITPHQFKLLIYHDNAIHVYPKGRIGASVSDIEFISMICLILLSKCKEVNKLEKKILVEHVIIACKDSDSDTAVMVHGGSQAV